MSSRFRGELDEEALVATINRQKEWGHARKNIINNIKWKKPDPNKDLEPFYCI